MQASFPSPINTPFSAPYPTLLGLPQLLSPLYIQPIIVAPLALRYRLFKESQWILALLALRTSQGRFQLAATTSHRNLRSMQIPYAADRRVLLKRMLLGMLEATQINPSMPRDFQHARIP